MPAPCTYVKVSAACQASLRFQHTELVHFSHQAHISLREQGRAKPLPALCNAVAFQEGTAL